ncbi:MAG TPA: YetF domain-containing protein [Daejeonella sp.]|nr:YetF domain-containing protein [Daejeonella sp.]
MLSPYTDIILRSAAVYIFMITAVRIFGKKELSQLSTADLIFIVLISNSVQNAMVGPDTSLTGGILAASVLFLLNYILKIWIFRSPRFKEIIEDKPIILIHRGKIDLENLRRVQITLDELEQAIHEHGVETYKDVRLAILEVDGNISVISGENSHLKQTHYKYRRKHKSLTNFQ